jgi:hypothetical protein
MTSIQLDEITEVRDNTRDDRHGRDSVCYYSHVWGAPRPVEAGTRAVWAARTLDADRSLHGNQSDALLTTTAKYEEAILVTEDRRLAKRARELSVEVWGAERLVAFILSLSSGRR